MKRLYLMILIFIIFLQISLSGCTSVLSEETPASSNEAMRNSSEINPDDADYTYKPVFYDVGEIRIFTNIFSENGHLLTTGYNSKSETIMGQLIKDGEFQQYPVNIPEDVYILEAVEQNNEIIYIETYNDDYSNPRHNLKKADKNGAIVFTFIIDGENTHDNNLNIIGMEIDSQGNIYICTSNEIIILNDAGSLLSRSEYDFDFTQIIKSGDNIYLIKKEETLSLCKIEIDSAKLVENINIPKEYNDCFVIGCIEDDSYIFLCDYEKIYRFTFIKEIVEIVDLIDIGINGNDLDLLTYMPSVGFVGAYWNSSTRTESIVFLERVSKSTVAEKIVLTLACNTNSVAINAAVSDFNKYNDEYKIEIIDYNEIYPDQALTRFDMDIAQGNAADIICLSGLSYETYAEKGLLQDLYTLIENDDTINTDDFWAEPLSAMEYKEHLYRISPSFSLVTMIALNSVVGDISSWDINSFISTYSNMPEETLAFYSQSKSEILYYFLFHTMGQFVDYENGNSTFDSEEFISLLEFINTFKEDALSNYAITESEALKEQIVMAIELFINDFESYQSARNVFGDDMICIGFPTNIGSGTQLYVTNTVGISAQSEYIDIAWEFVKSLITNSQYNNRGGFSFLKSKLQTQIEQVDRDIVTDESIQSVIELVNTISQSTNYNETILGIIIEDSASYFNGDKTAAEVASIIQNRISIYLSEYSG